MPIDPRYKLQGVGLRRDVRPWTVRTLEWMRKVDNFQMVLGVVVMMLLLPPSAQVDFSKLWPFVDIIFLFTILYVRWFLRQLPELPFKLPAYAPTKDKNNPTPGKSGPGKADGILFLGNVREGPSKGDELWLTNSDARTHILFLGTTGAGKTEGLKSLVTNAMCWGSGFVYVDGKAQNTLWGDVYSLARRFGRDDDVLVLNYMTGNSDAGSQSNSLNPFSIGSASYLTQMMVGLMDDSGDDNAMWKGRAISLMSALMPALTWKRDNQGMLMDVGVIRDHLGLQQIIKMSRDPGLPDRIIRGLQSYLDTLPGYVDSAFDDEGNERPQSPDQPMVDLSQTRQQHGYLTMQFTRSLSSLADEYGYIFKQQLADIDMMDVVLNRRILVVLIPALEKSPDEAANLGKIVVAALKGMMGATLGADLEGDQSSIIDNNPTRSDSPFMTIFDEVGYYTSPGMGVMAAQARSLGFSLVFAGQDMPALQKRVKEEALSITGNCNLKIFGKLEDPTETKDFFEKTVASAMVSEVSGFSASQGVSGRVYSEGDNISFQAKKEASYDDLRRQREGQVHFLWADKVVSANMFHASPPRVEAIRVQRFLAVSPKNWSVEARDKTMAEVINFFRGQGSGRGQPAAPQTPVAQEITWMAEGYQRLQKARQPGQDCACAAVAAIAAGLKRRASDVVPSNVGVPPGGQGYWPFGGAADPAAGATPPSGGAPPPPWLAAGAPPATVPPGAPSSPPWMRSGAAAPPPQQPPAGSPPPPWAQGGTTGAPAASSPPPPWATTGAAAGAPPPPWTAPGAPLPSGGVPPATGTGSQPLQWGNVMGGVTGMGTPPGGARLVQAPAVPPPPPWLRGGPPPTGSPPAAAPYAPPTPPPYQQQPQAPQTPPWATGSAAPFAAPPSAPPPWAGGGNVGGGAPPQAPPYTAGSPVSPPPFAAPPPAAPPVAAPPSPVAAPPPAAPPPAAPWPQHPVPPGQPWPQQPSAPPVAPQPPSVLPGTPAVAAPPQGGTSPSSWPASPPASWPPQQAAPSSPLPPAAPTAPPDTGVRDASQDVDAILRNAANNLSDEMFPDGQVPKGDEDQRKR